MRVEEAYERKICACEIDRSIDQSWHLEGLCAGGGYCAFQ